MPADTPYPTFGNPPRILDVRQTLQMIPAEVQDITGANPSALIRTSIPPLSFLLLADRLGELYEVIFPDHPEWLDEEMVDWPDEEAVAVAVERFLNRVSFLFPVHDDVWEIDLDVIEWRLHEIPITPFGYDYWYEDEWQEFQEPVVYLLTMSYLRGDEDSPFRRDEFADTYPDHPVPRYLEPQRLVDSLRQICAEHSRREMLPEPLAALPDLILMLHQSTGNSWLDVGECALADGGGYPLWSAENVEWLAEEWQKAQPILDRITALLNWKNDSPETVAEKVTAVRELLLEAYERTQQDEPADTAIPTTPV